jgi:uncharacterized phage protein (TIGR02218 family)
MKTISPELLASLTDGYAAMIFSIIASDGTSHYFTEHDNDLDVDGQTYTPYAGLTRTVMQLSNNAEVSNQKFTGVGIQLPDEELSSGKWDAAQVSMSLVDWRNVEYGTMPVFKGTIAAIQWTDVGFQADVQNYLRDLGKNIGTVTTANCRHDLYDVAGPGTIGGCGVNKADYQANGTVGKVLTQKLKFKIPSSGKTNGWATMGIVTFTSGTNSGLSYQVKVHEVNADANIGESLELFVPSIGNLVQGDTFTFNAGCNHLMSDCSTKFNNHANFGGFPHIVSDVNLAFSNG